MPKTIKSSLHTADARPTEKELNHHLIMEVAPRWREIGIELLDNHQVSHLDIIAANNHDVRKSCHEMLCFWLKSHPDANWHKIVAALQSPSVQLITIADVIQKKFTCHQHN